MEDIRVLIVDDSALMRSLIGKIIDNAPGLVVADKAMNGRFALQKLERVNPDIILLDLEMPEMNGLQFLQERKNRGIEIPVVVLSSIAKEGARITMNCLELGASDFVTKPYGAESPTIHTVANQIIEFATAYGRRYQTKKRLASLHTEAEKITRSYSHSSRMPSPADTQASSVTEQKKPLGSFLHKASSTVEGVTGISTLENTGSERPKRTRQPGSLELIAIGISTGGPNALREVFAHLDADLPQPIVVVQHMPAGFTEEFANSLNRICPLEVKEAVDGDLLRPGRILIAPGGKHLIVEKRSLAAVARIIEDPPENGHRPSADVLFRSVVTHFQNHALGIIMTGMGKDGAVELVKLYEAGSHTLGQDEASSIVYGMPRVAFEKGGVERQVSLKDMAQTINDYGKKYK